MTGKMKSFWRQTPGGKAGSIDGLNLFFGALLGANLGTMQSLALEEYVRLVLVLAASVMAIRTISTSERRDVVLVVVVICLLVAAGTLYVPMLQPKGLSGDSLHKLIGTLAIWLVCVLLVEFSPAQKPS
jgi:hypothetical protein